MTDKALTDKALTDDAMTDDGRLATADDVDPAALRAFLERSFGEGKARFLERHGTWWHDGAENRIVLESGGTVAAYCGVIPARIRLGGEIRDALWWMDLVVAPELRGRGLQTILDEEVRRRCDLLLGFPNELAAKIHRKHGWGVREDLRVVLAPLRPAQLGAVRRATGPRGLLLRTAARALAPGFALWRRRLLRATPKRARRLEAPDVEEWARLAGRFTGAEATTLRDERYLRHRFLEAPYRDELHFYSADSVVLIVRRCRRAGHVEERVLDVFGDLDDHEALADVLRLALREAARAGAVQVTALVGPPDLVSVFRRCGFPVTSTGRFCWSSSDTGVLSALQQARLHWTLADSDNDEPA